MVANPLVAMLITDHIVCIMNCMQQVLWHVDVLTPAVEFDPQCIYVNHTLYVCIQINLVEIEFLTFQISKNNVQNKVIQSGN